jgi:hypothetical protein
MKSKQNIPDKSLRNVTVVKRNNLVSDAYNDETISKKLNDSMLERIFDQ